MRFLNRNDELETHDEYLAAFSSLLLSSFLPVLIQFVLDFLLGTSGTTG